MTFEAVLQQITAANTTQQREDARRVLQQWVSAHPEDQFAPDLFYLLDCMEEDARKSAASWKALQIKLKTQGAARLSRDETARIIMAASSLEEIAEAWQLLRDWLRRHPEDDGMRDLGGQLYTLEDGHRTEAIEQVAVAA